MKEKYEEREKGKTRKKECESGRVCVSCCVCDLVSLSSQNGM
jgi:hypothetical protein